MIWKRRRTQRDFSDEVSAHLEIEAGYRQDVAVGFAELADEEGSGGHPEKLMDGETETYGTPSLRPTVTSAGSRPP